MDQNTTDPFLIIHSIICITYGDGRGREVGTHKNQQSVVRSEAGVLTAGGGASANSDGKPLKGWAV